MNILLTLEVMIYRVNLKFKLYFLYYKLIFLLVMTIWLLKLEPEHYYFEGGVD